MNLQYSFFRLEYEVIAIYCSSKKLLNKNCDTSSFHYHRVLLFCNSVPELSNVITSAINGFSFFLFRAYKNVLINVQSIKWINL